MKTLICSILFVLTANVCTGQLIKKIGNDIKNETEWKIRSKARQKTNQALDSLMSPADKKNKKKKKETKASGPVGQKATVNAKGSKDAEEMSVGNGFIKLAVSATTVFRGGTIVITGSSVRYKELDNVKLVISGKEDTQTETLKLYENGSFSTGWQAEESGEFTLTVASSDNKDRQSVKVTVTDMELMDDWTEGNIQETKKAVKKLEESIDDAKGSISSRDREKLEAMFKQVKQTADIAIKLFTDLNTGAKQFGQLAKGKDIPPNIAGNLSQLNDLVTKQRQEMQQVNELADHKPYDNTICEYLVMINEACAAFSTFSNIWGTSATALLKNIALDKGVPKTVEVINQKTVNTGDTYNFLGKEGAKIFATAKFDAESLTSKMGKAGVAGDILQFVSDVLIKSYCGVFKGEVTHKYTIIYRNSNKVIWWQYSYETKSAVTFRYPKSNTGSVVKMKGNIEGNATSFRFTQDVEQNDDFRNAMKGRAKLVSVKLHEPVVIPFSTSQNDELGFGAIARGIVTPAYFNIPVDAEYDKDANTVKLFVNNPLIDFTPTVKYTYGYIAIGAGIPLVTRVDFPINKSRPTLNAVISKNNEMTVTRNAQNKDVIKGKGERHIGSESEPIEHKISFTLSATTD